MNNSGIRMLCHCNLLCFIQVRSIALKNKVCSGNPESDFVLHLKNLFGYVCIIGYLRGEQNPPCASSAIDRADCHIPLLEDNVHHILNLLCRACGCLVEGGADHQTIGFGVGGQIACCEGTRADSSGILRV